MRVAITHTRYTNQGGVERYIWDLVRRLCEEGHDVHFFCHFTDEHADPRVTIHKVPNTWKQIRFMKVWSFDRWLTQHVKADEWDIVHGFTKTSFQDVYTDGSGCLLDYQQYSIDHAGGSALKKSLKRASLHQKVILEIEKRRFTRGNFQRIVVMSDLVGDQIKRRYALDSSEVITIYNGIDTERFSLAGRDRWRIEIRDRIVVPQSAFVVLCVANDYKRKGVPALIEAARIVRERGGIPDGRLLRIAVVGKESFQYEKELTHLAQAKGVSENIKFYGPQSEIQRWYGVADAMFLPTRFDAFGNVVLEAMAAGLPCVVSDRAGAAEVVVEGKTGWVLPDPDDSIGMAQRILDLARDPKLLADMSLAARAEAETYSWDRHFKAMLRLYEEVLALKRISKRRIA
ncbi:MAG: glycosyltransferase family 4 protein [Planctomycetes bacterium]|nr:glycosyltransferase family 4 protein [Planctomycetota bacterium]